VSRLGELVGCVTIGVVAALGVVWTADRDVPPAPEPSPVIGQVPQGQPFEDEPGWNCLTMGNQTCGPDWAPLTAEQLRGITWSHDGYDDWQGCLTDGVTVVCDDGYVYVWVKVPADLAA